MSLRQRAREMFYNETGFDNAEETVLGAQNGWVRTGTRYEYCEVSDDVSIEKLNELGQDGWQISGTRNEMYILVRALSSTVKPAPVGYFQRVRY